MAIDPETKTAARLRYTSGHETIPQIAKALDLSSDTLYTWSREEGWVALRKVAREAALAEEVKLAAERIRAFRPHHLNRLIDIAALSADVAIDELTKDGEKDVVAAAAAARCSIESAKRVEELAAEVGEATGMGAMVIEIPSRAGSSSGTKSLTQPHSSEKKTGSSGRYPRKDGSS